MIPLVERNEDGSWPVTDDMYVAGSWTLTAHEARPGHEMQFSSVIESGVSTARAIFAFNSANVEGWGLYSEVIVQQYLSPEAQLFGLKARLIRAARAFLDPMLNLYDASGTLIAFDDNAPRTLELDTERIDERRALHAGRPEHVIGIDSDGTARRFGAQTELVDVGHARDASGCPIRG